MQHTNNSITVIQVSSLID